MIPNEAIAATANTTFSRPRTIGASAGKTRWRNASTDNDQAAELIASAVSGHHACVSVTAVPVAHNTSSRVRGAVVKYA